jgi:hypothetical protein
LIGPGDEAARPPSGPAFADAVTFAFGDAEQELYGLARLGLSPGGEGDGGAASGSALAVLFSGRDPVAAVAHGGLPATGSFEALALEGLSATVQAPLERWTLALDAEAGGFDLTFEALGPPAELAPEEPAARSGGMAGYEQLCAVRGTVRARGRSVELRCLGQRGHLWGEPDWKRIESTRTIAAWPAEGPALALTSIRPAGASDHEAEPVWAALLDTDGSRRIADPRVSTTYDADGRQRRAGLELWLGDEDGYPRRGSGRVLCGSSLDLGQLRLDCAFFRWHIEGRPAVGRYDILRRTA